MSTMDMDSLYSDFWGPTLPTYTGDIDQFEDTNPQEPSSSTDWLAANLPPTFDSPTFDSPPLTPEEELQQDHLVHPQHYNQEAVYTMDSLDCPIIDDNLLESLSSSCAEAKSSGYEAPAAAVDRNDDISLAFLSASCDADMDSLMPIGSAAPACNNHGGGKQRRKAKCDRVERELQQRRQQEDESSQLSDIMNEVTSETNRILEMFQMKIPDKDDAQLHEDDVDADDDCFISAYTPPTPHSHNSCNNAPTFHASAKVDGGLKREASGSSTDEHQAKKACHPQQTRKIKSFSTSTVPLRVPISSAPAAQPPSIIVSNGNGGASRQQVVSINNLKSFIVNPQHKQQQPSKLIHLSHDRKIIARGGGDVPLVGVIAPPGGDGGGGKSSNMGAQQAIKLEPGVAGKPVFVIPTSATANGGGGGKIAIVKQHQPNDRITAASPATVLNQQKQQVIKVITNTQQQQQQQKPVILSNYLITTAAATPITNHEVVQHRTKPLMGSINGRHQKPIVPAPQVTHNHNHQQQVVHTSPLPVKTSPARSVSVGDGPPSCTNPNLSFQVKPPQDQRPQTDIDRLNKRQQRMIKNRESASQSRQRKKQHIQELENQVSVLMGHNSQLQGEVRKLKHQCRKLESEVETYRKLLQLDGVGGDDTTTSMWHNKTNNNNNKSKPLFLLSLFLLLGFSLGPFSVFSNMDVATSQKPSSISATNNVPALLDQQQQQANHHQQEEGRRNKFPSHHSRQLLSIALAGADDDDDDDGSDDVSANTSSPAGGGDGTDDYWIDDVVRSYKQETLRRVLDLFRSTQSNSLQRILRRKLKEELGFRVPLYPTATTTATGRTRRVLTTAAPSSLAAAAAAPGIRNQHRPIATTYDSLLVDQRQAENSDHGDGQQVEVEMPPTAISDDDDDAENSNRQGALPCASVDGDEDSNGSELLKSKLDWWISTHEVSRRINNKQESDDEAVASTRMKFRRRGRRSRNGNKNKVALYSKTDRRDMAMFWKAFGRRNDTYYVVDLKQDQIILPPLVRNLSSKTRLSLLFSAAPPDEGEEREGQNEEGRVVNMIKIECEVNSSEYLKISKDLLPTGYHAHQQQPPQGNEQHIGSRDGGGGERETGEP